jgi:hypothetical protein
MEALAKEYRPKGFEFLFVLTREAHPGENYPHHSSWEQKLRHAEAFRDRFSVRRQILVDDLEGTVHHQYGLLPDMCWLIGKKNLILFKADWTNADALRMILDYQLERVAQRQSNVKVGPNYCEFLGFRPRMWPNFVSHLRVNGEQAIADWKAALEYWKLHPPTHG